jgi:hypothetical protein
MPQPISRVRPDANIRMAIAGERPLTHNPRIGLLAMEAIISWSNVEAFMLKMYQQLLGGPNEIAAVAYLALEAQSAKIAMIHAVARHKLEAKYYDLLQAILRCVRTGQRHRDKLAHWTWGYSPQLPDGFLLRDPKSTNDLDRDNIFVYKEADFVNIIENNDKLCRYGLRFHFILVGQNEDDRIYHELCSEPEIRERLTHHQS